MRVLHIIPTLKKGGAERLAIDICKALNKQDKVNCKLISIHPGNEFEFLLKGLDHQVIPTRFIPSISGKATIDVEKLTAFFIEFQPDVIHTHLFEAELVSRATNYSKAVYFSHCHNNMPPFERFSVKTLFNKNLLLRNYEKHCLLKMYRETGGNNFITISNDNFSFFKRNLPSDLQNISLLFNAINVPLFLSDKPRQAPTKVLKLVTVGSLVDNKNQIFFIEVVKILKARGIKVKLDILGDGPNRNLIQEKIETERLQEDIELHGSVDKVEHYLWDSHIYVHATISEAFGLVLVEAMAAGLPVVSLDGKGNRDLIEEGANGYMVSSGNVDDFVDKILLLYHNPKLYTQISNYAIQFAQRFDIKPYIRKLLDLYKQARAAKKITSEIGVK